MFKSYLPNVKEQAITLRKKGYSLRELSKFLGISKSTASEWSRDIWLDDHARKALEEKSIKGRINIFLAHQTKRQKKERITISVNENVHQSYKNHKFSENSQKMLCAFLYWAEGSKVSNSVTFTNSDPLMIKTFLKLFRTNFQIDESRLHAIVHIHEYHNDNEIKNYWAENTNIPINNFYNSYKKPHTGINKHEGYKGCIQISYYDYKIATELHSIYNAYAQFFL